jgi:uncharacterized protein
MDWEKGRRSRNVEDRRGTRIGAPIAVGGGLGTILIALLVTFLGGDPSMIFNQGNSSVDYPTTETPPTTNSPANDEMTDFVSVVLADTEDTWHSIFQENGATYIEPKLVLYSGSVESAS